MDAGISPAHPLEEQMCMTRSIRSALLTLGLAALGACGDATGSSRGAVTILLKDAPGDVKKAVVTIDQIYLQPGTDSGASRVVLRSAPVTGDLLQLRNDIAALVEDAIVPPGTYGQLRFVISGGCLAAEDTNGSTKIFSSSASYAGLALCTADGGTTGGTLQMPSFAQTGIKVTLPDGFFVANGPLVVSPSTNLIVPESADEPFTSDLSNVTATSAAAPPTV